MTGKFLISFYVITIGNNNVQGTYRHLEMFTSSCLVKISKSKCTLCVLVVCIVLYSL